VKPALSDEKPPEKWSKNLKDEFLLQYLFSGMHKEGVGPEVMNVLGRHLREYVNCRDPRRERIIGDCPTCGTGGEVRIFCRACNYQFQ